MDTFNPNQMPPMPTQIVEEKKSMCFKLIYFNQSVVATFNLSVDYSQYLFMKSTLSFHLVKFTTK